jgi:hypothetical protein
MRLTSIQNGCCTLARQIVRKPEPEVRHALDQPLVMIQVTHEMLPALRVIAGFVTIARPLPSDAVLTPRMALEYAGKLIEAAAKAEGDRLIRATGRSRQKKAAPKDGLKF